MAAFTVIGHHECTTTDAVVTFTSIPSSYDHLMMTLSVRADHATYESGVNVNFNNDTGSNYSYTRLQALTSTPASSRVSGTAYGQWSACAGSSVLADTFASAVVWVPHYANTANFKTWTSRCVKPNNSNTDSQWAVQIEAGLWSDTPAAISEIDMSPASGSFVQYSNFTLYGVTGA